MTHPTSELADYVDGTLSAPDRARVQAHLEECRRCSSETAAARRAVAALAVLEEEPVPAGVASRVTRQARTTAGVNRISASRRFGAAALAAAALLAGILILRSPHSQEPVAGSAAAPGFASSSADGEPGRYDLDGNYSASELAAMAARRAKQLDTASDTGSDTTREGALSGTAAGAASPSLAPAPAPAAEKAGISPTAGGLPQQIADNAKLDKCLGVIGAFDKGGTLIDAFQARYEGIRAYFAVLAEGPSAEASMDRVVVWVFAPTGCDILAFTQQRYPSVIPSPVPLTATPP